jgi:cyclin T
MSQSLQQPPPPPPPSLQPEPTSQFIEVNANEEDEIKRRKTCRFIEEAGRVLKLPRVAISTAEVFFHRFYAKHSFQDHDRFEVAVAAIVLAAKTEEAPKKLNVVIQECYKLKARGMQAGRISSQQQPQQQQLDGGSNSSGGSPPPLSSMQTISASLDPKGDDFLKLKDRILLLERIILHTIGFELSIDHPYKVSGTQIF